MFALRQSAMESVFLSAAVTISRARSVSLGSRVTDLKNDVPRILWANSIDDRISASFALAGKLIFIRGEKRLYCMEDQW